MSAEYSLRILKLTNEERFFLVNKLENYLSDNKNEIEKNEAAVKSFKYMKKQLYFNRISYFLTKLEPGWLKQDKKITNDFLKIMRMSNIDQKELKLIVNNLKKKGIKYTINKHFDTISNIFNNTMEMSDYLVYSLKYIELYFEFFKKFLSITTTQIESFFESSCYLVKQLNKIVEQEKHEESIYEILSMHENVDFFLNYKKDIFHKMCENHDNLIQDCNDEEHLDQEYPACCYHMNPKTDDYFNEFINVFTYYKSLDDCFDIENIKNKLLNKIKNSKNVIKEKYEIIYNNFILIVENEDNYLIDLKDIVNNMVMKLLLDINLPNLKSIDFHRIYNYSSNNYIDENNVNHITVDLLQYFIIKLWKNLDKSNDDEFIYIITKIMNYFVNYVDSVDDEMLYKDSSFFNYLSNNVQSATCIIANYFRLLSLFHDKLYNLKNEDDFAKKNNVKEFDNLYQKCNNIYSKLISKITFEKQVKITKKEQYIYDKSNDFVIDSSQVKLLSGAQYGEIDGVLEIMRNTEIKKLKDFVFTTLTEKREWKKDKVKLKTMKSFHMLDINTFSTLEQVTKNGTLLSKNNLLPEKRKIHDNTIFSIIDILSENKDCTSKIKENQTKVKSITIVDVLNEMNKSYSLSSIDEKEEDIPLNLTQLQDEYDLLKDEIEILELQGIDDNVKNARFEELESLIEFQKYEVEEKRDNKKNENGNKINMIIDQINLIKEKIKLSEKELDSNKLRKYQDEIEKLQYKISTLQSNKPFIGKDGKLDLGDGMILYKKYEEVVSIKPSLNIDRNLEQLIQNFDKEFEKENKLIEDEISFKEQLKMKEFLISNYVFELEKVFNIKTHASFNSQILSIYKNWYLNGNNDKKFHGIKQKILQLIKTHVKAVSFIDKLSFEVQISNNILKILTILHFVINHENEIRNCESKQINLNESLQKKSVLEKYIGKNIIITDTKKVGNVLKFENNMLYVKLSNEDKIIKLKSEEQFSIKEEYIGEVCQIIGPTIWKGTIGIILSSIYGNDEEFIITEGTYGQNSPKYLPGVNKFCINKKYIKILKNYYNKNERVEHHIVNTKSLVDLIKNGKYNLYTIVESIYNMLSDSKKLHLDLKDKYYNYFYDIYKISLSFYNKLKINQNEEFIKANVIYQKLEELKEKIQSSETNLHDISSLKKKYKRMKKIYENIKVNNKRNNISKNNITIMVLDNEDYNNKSNFEVNKYVKIIEELDCSYFTYTLDTINKVSQTLINKKKNDKRVEQIHKRQILKESRNVFDNFLTELDSF